MALSIEALLSAMLEERKKSRSDEDDGFVLVDDVNSHWPYLFDTFFLSKSTRLAQPSTCVTSDDDLIFYVSRKSDDDSVRPTRNIEVYRHHDVKRQPKLASPAYDWEETTNLNLILHQFEYTVTAAVCIKETSKTLKNLKTLSTRVYASPSRRDMETKGTGEKITFPNIYFTVDNFEDKFCEMAVHPGEMVCVELVAANPQLEKPKVLFIGSIKYEVLKQVYDSRASTGNRVAERVTFGIYSKDRVEFVRMRGPNGKGHAEMAVSRYRSTKSEVSSPASTPVSPEFDENDWNKRDTIDNASDLSSNPPTGSQNETHRNSDTPEVDSADIRQESPEESGGLLGRTIGQAMSWMRHSTSRQNLAKQAVPLQTCLTYINLPCQSIIKDILESKTVPLLKR